MIEVGNDIDGNLRQGFAGDTANLAVYLSRLLPAADVHYVTALGDDYFSDGMVDFWQQEGIGAGLVRRLPGRLPGIYWIRTDATGERGFYYWRDHSAARALLDDGYVQSLERALGGFDWLCVSGITLAILPDEHREQLLAMLARLRSATAGIFLDTNFRPRLWDSHEAARRWHESALAAADIVSASYEDEQALFGDESPDRTLDRIIAHGAREVVVRNGPGPCHVHADGEKHVIEPVAEKQALDTTGAGDAFDAAYLAARCAGQTAYASAHAGRRLAALVVQWPGAILAGPGTPGLADLLA